MPNHPNLHTANPGFGIFCSQGGIEGERRDQACTCGAGPCGRLGDLYAPTGILAWTPIITTPGGVWTYSFVVTVQAGYTGTLVNTVQVTTNEDANGTAVVITNSKKVYLPIVLRN